MNIVAPAGNLERFYAALQGGADEIYMGLKGFGARRNAENFTLDEYIEAIDCAHEAGAQVFLTMNTVMRDSEIEALYQNIKTLYEKGLDAVIVQDLGMFSFIRDNFPKIAVHGSTQMTVANHVEADYLKKIGFKRVVLARELSFEEIRTIRGKTDIELEVFVSGALCISYSGNCYLSSFIGGRSGNRGLCAQPCRKSYQREDKSRGYYLSPKDQLMEAEEIEKLKSIGVDAIKIEGRMKSPQYVFETVNHYSGIMKGDEFREKTSDLFNRGYSKGYFYGENDKILNPDYASDFGKLVGEIRGKEVKLKEPLILGDGVSFVSKDYEKLGGEYVNRIRIKGEKELRKSAEPGEVILLEKPPRGGRYLYRNYNKSVNDDALWKMKRAGRKAETCGEFIGKTGERALLILWCMNSNGEKITAQYRSELPLEEAAKNPLSHNKISEKICETGDTTFQIKDLEIDFDERAFLPLSLLKEMRRETLKVLREKLLLSYRRESPEEMKKRFFEKNIEKKVSFSAVVSNKDQERAVKEAGLEKVYRRGIDIAKEGALDTMDLNSPLASNLYQLLENRNSQLLVNWNLNITNTYALEELEKLGKDLTAILSPELSLERIKDIGEVGLKKGVMIYGKLKGMFVELSLFENKKEIIKNEQGDSFTVIKNSQGNSELFFEKPMNLIPKLDEIVKAGIDELVLEFTDESEDEVKKIIGSIEKREGEYIPYNYERGVF